MSNTEINPYTSEDEIEIDLRELLQVLKKWSKLIIGMSLLCALSAALITYYIISPVYEAKTMLVVNQATDKLQSAPSRQADNLEDVVGSVSRIPVWTMNTYVGQLKSEALMKRVIGILKLDCSPGALATMINASIVKDSNLINVSVQNTDAVMASRIGNTLCEEYLKMMNEKNQEQMSRSVSFLQEQKEKTEKELAVAIEELKIFECQPRGVAVVEAEFNRISEDAINYDSRFKSVQIEIRRLSSGVETLQEEVNSTPRTILVEKYNGEASTQEINPLYVSIAQQLSEKKAALSEKQGESETLQVLIESMKSEMDFLQAELVQKRVQKEKLERKVDRLKDTDDTLSKKETETQIAKSIDLGSTTVLVLSPASIPSNPVKPNKKLNIAIALVLGIMIFTLLAFLLEYLDNTLKSSEDVSRELGLPVLGVIPEEGKNNRGYYGYGG